MQTIILGGGSVKNKIWLENCASQLQELDTKPFFYEHWKSDENSFIDFNVEIQKLANIIDHKPFNLIAKSAGTILGSKFLFEDSSQQINKIIFCGLPLNDFSTEEKEVYKILKSYDPINTLCFQNSLDPHGTYDEAKIFLDRLNPEIKIVSKQSDTHDYPYFEDFKLFLSE